MMVKEHKVTLPQFQCYITNFLQFWKVAYFELGGPLVGGQKLNPIIFNMYNIIEDKQIKRSSLLVGLFRLSYFSILLWLYFVLLYIRLYDLHASV